MGITEDAQPVPFEEIERGPTRSWMAFVAVIATIGILLIAPYIAVAAARGYGWVVGLGEARAYAPGEFDRLLMFHEAVYQAAFDSALILLTVLTARVLLQNSPQNTSGLLALNAPSAGLGAYLEAALIVAAAAAVWFALAFLAFPQDVVSDIKPYRELMVRQGGWVMPPIYCLLAPVAEEVLFRGFLFRALMRSQIGICGAAVLTSAGWMVLHTDRSIVGLAQIFALGLLFSFLLVRSDSLRVPIAGHVFFNTALSLIVFTSFPVE